jgi:hypothetical protein
MAMSTALKIVLGLVALVVILGVGCVASIIGINNDFVAKEESIQAQYKQNQNNYDSMWKKIKEVASVPEMYKDDMKEVFNSAIAGRYGEKGSQAMFQWIKEHNPNFDASLYTKIQTVIESGRDSFAADQKVLLDMKRVYQTRLKKFPHSLVANNLGYPKIDLAQFDIVTSGKTEEVFKTKKDDAPIKLREDS